MITGNHTWTWAEIRPMLRNSKEQIEAFEKRYKGLPENGMITTSNSQDIEAWEMLENIGLAPIMKPAHWNRLKIENEAFYTGPDLKNHTINEKDIHQYRIPVDEFANEDAKQQFAEQWLLVRLDFVKGRDYVSATISDEGLIIFQPNTPIEYLKFEMGVLK